MATEEEAMSCLLHAETGTMVEGCGNCDAEIASFQTTMAKMSDRIAGKHRDLFKSGYEVPEAMILATRLELLIDTIFNDRQRMAFEQGSGERIVAALSEMQSQVRKQTLAPQKSLIVPGRH